MQLSVSVLYFTIKDMLELKIYLVFDDPGSWIHKTPKTFGISPVMGISFVIHKKHLLSTPEFMWMRWLKMGPLDSHRIGLVSRRTKWQRFLIFSLSSKLIQPVEESMRTSNIQLVNRSAGNKDLHLAAEVVVLWDWVLKPWDLMLFRNWVKFIVHSISVRWELNCLYWKKYIGEGYKNSFAKNKNSTE